MGVETAGGNNSTTNQSEPFQLVLSNSPSTGIFSLWKRPMIFNQPYSTLFSLLYSKKLNLLINLHCDILQGYAITFLLNFLN